MLQHNLRWKYLNYLNALLLALVLNYSLCIGAEANKCRAQETCRACIQYKDAECTWCAQKDYVQRQTELDRCDLIPYHKQQNCSNIVNPLSDVNSTKNKKLTNTTKVTPQEVELSLRPGQKKTFNISVRTPENYPVDVYMLMDMSYSMKENLPSVKKLGRDLGTEMKDITSRFRVGFGTMVDKPLAPYAEPSPDYWKKQNETVSPWVFRNKLPLTVKTDVFEASVQSSKLSETIDPADCWTDALMQVAVCENALKWSPKQEARRLVVIATEDEFHIAGDGLLGGIVSPNDGQCKLGNSDTYLGTQMDYPSLAHLRFALSENRVVPIFAVDEHAFDIYKAVQEYFGDEIGAEVGIVRDNSSNIVKLIRNTYEKIGQKQTVFHNAEDTKDLKIEYVAHCLDGTYPGRTCNNVNIGKTVHFTVSVTLENCPADGKGYTEFAITTALGDSVPIKVKYLCDCECSNETVRNSTECSGQGSFTCGDCTCNPGYLGEQCDCPDTEKDKNNEMCKAPNSTSVCSGRGECECGKCRCGGEKFGFSRIDGEFCECSELLCDRDENGNICGGIERGVCDCDRCKCLPGWEGPACSCRNITTACIQNNVTCSGRGGCECGQCVCDPNYSGKFCETCDGCVKGCSYYKDCVRCKIYRTGPIKGDCEKSCNATITNVDNAESYENRGTVCVEIDDDDDCTFSYVLNEGSEKVQIFADEDKICPREEEYLLIIIGVILGIVAIGAALLLIWKLLATIQDRREFAKFEREQQNARWDTSENPIFKQATTTFQNPTYGGKG